MVLSRQEILDLILKEKLLENFVDLKSQLQPASFDFTLNKVFSLEGKGKLDFDNSERILSEPREISF